MSHVNQVMQEMIEYYGTDVRRINHFLKVYGYAKTIAETEGLDQNLCEITEILGLIHDIGIKNSEVKYGSSSGIYQQIEGPDEARKLLTKIKVDRLQIERICYVIAHHHEYTDIDGLDYQILVEADFLVNAYEDELSKDVIKTFEETIFKTQTGLKLLDSIYG